MSPALSLILRNFCSGSVGSSRGIRFYEGRSSSRRVQRGKVTKPRQGVTSKVRDKLVRARVRVYQPHNYQNATPAQHAHAHESHIFLSGEIALSYNVLSLCFFDFAGGEEAGSSLNLCGGLGIY
jgi:hypothetical protein